MASLTSSIFALPDPLRTWQASRPVFLGGRALFHQHAADVRVATHCLGRPRPFNGSAADAKSAGDLPPPAALAEVDLLPVPTSIEDETYLLRCLLLQLETAASYTDKASVQHWTPGTVAAGIEQLQTKTTAIFLTRITAPLSYNIPSF